MIIMFDQCINSSTRHLPFYSKYVHFLISFTLFNDYLWKLNKSYYIEIHHLLIYYIDENNCSFFQRKKNVAIFDIIRNFIFFLLF